MKKYFFYYALPLFGLLGLSSCSDNDDDYKDPDDSVIIEDSKSSQATQSQGFYVVNEDWFGHDNGTVNYFKNDGSIVYRAYRAANNNETLGLTTQFATIYGDNVYFVSKQGDRFIVADAKTWKKKAVFSDNIGGDGRSFIGVDSNLGYIGTSKGVTSFNIKELSVGSAVEGISGQVGNMCLVGNRVFVLVQSKGIYTISIADNTAELVVQGSYNCMTQSKDGNLWIGAGSKLIGLNPYTLEETEIALSGTAIDGSWGAWNAGSLCASTQQNAIYWTKGASVAKYDIDQKNLNVSLYTLGKDEQEKQLGFYAASLRVDPLSDKLVLMVKRNGWGDAGSYNWLHILNNGGSLEKTIVVNGDNGLGSEWGTNNDRYFWFPAMPFFEDVNAPEILINQIVLKPNEKKVINLNEKIVDADNTSTSIIKSVVFNQENDLVKYELKQDSLSITALEKTGKVRFTLKANSNGKIVEKEIRIDIRE